jgi:hypothetical protein
MPDMPAPMMIASKVSGSLPMIAPPSLPLWFEFQVQGLIALLPRISQGSSTGHYNCQLVFGYGRCERQFVAVASPEKPVKRFNKRVNRSSMAVDQAGHPAGGDRIDMREANHWTYMTRL